MKGAKEYILTLSCPDATGIVHAVSGLLYQAGCNIVDSQQFGDVQDDDATAHYVTPDLDEGPIIEQDVARVDHGDSIDEMTAAGRDVECLVLARAVRWHTEYRVLLNGHKTVVFR
jgi:formyltetrahydrofolate hydrolase